MDNNQQPNQPINPQQPNPNQGNPSNYFYPVDEAGQQQYKEKMSIYGNKFHYYAVQVWPYVTKVLEFFFFWTRKTIGGIISIAKDQIKQ